jgi:cyclopropane fatty-acyl-phospholipid synthase-like methyltransferase
MKQVNPKFYNQSYFQKQSSSPDFNKKIKTTDFQSKYRQIISLSKIKKGDTVCDYACGAGDLAFLISLKYNCPVVAIDYSPDAIKICKEKLKLFKKYTNPKANIKFLNKTNKGLPVLKNIKAIFFCDVFEHLYNSEIKLIISKIKQWTNIPNIIVHTDNNNYLKFIHPIINTISLLSKGTTIKKIKKNKIFNQKRHINLTNPKDLKKKMESFSFEEVKLKYPKPSLIAIKNQIRSLSKFKKLNKLILLIIKKIPFLSPSFFALYQFNLRSKSDAALKSGY